MHATMAFLASKGVTLARGAARHVGQLSVRYFSPSPHRQYHHHQYHHHQYLHKYCSNSRGLDFPLGPPRLICRHGRAVLFTV